MTTAAAFDADLLGRLPPVRGRYAKSAPLGRITRFQAGGLAEVMFRPSSVEDLAEFLAAKPQDVPVTLIGMGSNLLVRDGGVPGVTVRLGRAFAGIDVDGDKIIAGAAALDFNVAAAAHEASLGGLEFLSSIPGAIGGALRINAGAYGRETKDVLILAQALGPNGQFYELPVEEMDLGYRRCGLPNDWIFIGAQFAGHIADKAKIAARMEEIRQSRKSSQPLHGHTGGSTFANPPGARAWKLIEQAGCRGLRQGGAMVSQKHCNFMINTGGATAADIEGLGEKVRRRVLETTGMRLRWEIRRIGIPSAPLAGKEAS